MYMNNTVNFEGSDVVITGNIKADLKLEAKKCFTTSIIDTTSFEKFTPRILFASASSIGAGLDTPDVYTVL